MVKRLRNGENGAMEEFYSQNETYLKGICSRYITNKEDAKDVFQNAVIRILTHIADFNYQGAGSLRTWAARLVVNEALRFLSNTKRHELTTWDEDITDVVEEEDPPIEDIPPEVIHQMVKQLPTGYRTVFNLYVFEEKSHKEISRLLGISIGTSTSQLYRAKNLLADMIREYNDKKQ